MFAERFQEGDLVYALDDLFSDGAIPDTAEGDLLAPKGTRGMVVRVGHLETEPEVPVYLVRFEDPSGELGPPLGCVTEELTQQLEPTSEPALP